MHRPRVHKPHLHGPRVAQAAGLGIALGVFLELSRPLTMFWFGISYFALPFPWWPLISFVAPLLLLGVFQRKCGHLRWCLVTGGTLVGCFLAALPLFHLQPISGFDISLAEGLLDAAASLIVGGLFGGLLNVGLAKLKQVLWGQLIVQDGTLCPNCAYIVAHLPEPRCPECAFRFSPADLDPSLPVRTRAWKRLALRVGFCLGASTAIYLTYPHVLIRGADTWIGYVLPPDYLALEPRYSRSILLEYLREGDDYQRTYSASELYLVFSPYAGGLAPDEEALGTLAEAATSDPDTLVRHLAISTIALLSERKLYEILPLILQDEDPDVRWSGLAMAAAGGMAPNPKGTPWLIRALDDHDLSVRTRAYQRLRANTGQSFSFDPAGSETDRAIQQAVFRAWWEGSAAGNMP